VLLHYAELDTRINQGIADYEAATRLACQHIIAFFDAKLRLPCSPVLLARPGVQREGCALRIHGHYNPVPSRNFHRAVQDLAA